MTTSGTSTYNNTADDIIRAALRKVGVGMQGEAPTASAFQDAKADLDRIVKSWQAQGYHLWTIQEGVLYLENGETKYSLGSTGDRSSLTSSAKETTTTADALSGATTVTVDSITGLSSGMQFGIVGDDNVIFWTTISGAPSGSTVTLASPLTADISSGAVVYAYTTKITRPARIVQARVVVNSTSEIEMTMLSDTDYFMLANKYASGVPTQYYYQPNLDNGTFYVWPTTNDEAYTIKFTFESELQDVGVLTNTLQFPQEWLKALVWALAEEVMLEYGVDQATQVAIAAKSAAALDEALAFDQEVASVMLQPYPDYSGTVYGTWR